jgi:hypothetical protein
MASHMRSEVATLALIGGFHFKITILCIIQKYINYIRVSFIQQICTHF